MKTKKEQALMDVSVFTPTQRKIVEKLLDGLPHPKEELFSCLPDDLGDPNNLNKHITLIRGIIRRTGYDITCDRTDNYSFRLVRMLASPYKE